MGHLPHGPCPRCKPLFDALQARIVALETLVHQQAARITELEAKLQKATRNSTNSSKPPSSDIVSPPRPRHRGRRHIGAQEGHAAHFRQPFTPEQVDTVLDHRPDRCPRCGGTLDPLPDAPQIVQQADLPERPVIITEHRLYRCYCRSCRRTVEGTLPPEIGKSGLFGARLMGWAAWMKIASHASYSTLQTFCEDVLHLRVSRGYLAKVLSRTSAALQPAYESLRQTLPQAERVHVDETGHKERGKNQWTWVFRTPEFTLYHIDPSRGAKVLESLLGKGFGGVLSSDCFSAYGKYIGQYHVQVQFCLAHLIREIKFLCESTHRVTANYGKRLLKALKTLFRLIHRRERLSPERFARRLAALRDDILAMGRHGPSTEGARQLTQRFRRYGKAYFTFVTTPNVEPTNNVAERALRFIVIDRRLTQGTRTANGRRISERLWTTKATCLQQGRSFFDFLHQSLRACLRHEAAPSLLPTGP
jgi:transposase